MTDGGPMDDDAFYNEAPAMDEVVVRLVLKRDVADKLDELSLAILAEFDLPGLKLALERHEPPQKTRDMTPKLAGLIDRRQPYQPYVRRLNRILQHGQLSSEQDDEPVQLCDLTFKREHRGRPLGVRRRVLLDQLCADVRRRPPVRLQDLTVIVLLDTAIWPDLRHVRAVHLRRDRRSVDAELEPRPLDDVVEVGERVCGGDEVHLDAATGDKYEHVVAQLLERQWTAQTTAARLDQLERLLQYEAEPQSHPLVRRYGRRVEDRLVERTVELRDLLADRRGHGALPSSASDILAATASASLSLSCDMNFFRPCR